MSPKAPTSFEEYLESPEVASERDRLCHGHQKLSL